MEILIAEDDAMSQKLLERTLTKLNYEVIVTRDGEEAWSIFQRQDVRILISDWMMPNLSGLELCKMIRAEHRQQYTYVILLTALDGKGSCLQGLGSGADDFITKPFDKDVLAARLKVAERILEQQSYLRKLEQLLTVCAYCRKIEKEDESWEQIDAYLQKKGVANFSHGFCPACYKEHLKPQLDELKKRKKSE